MINLQKISIMILVFVSIAFAVGISINAAETPKKIRIIYTNDMMSYLEPCGCHGNKEGGLSRRSTIINGLIKENPNSIVVDSGNFSFSAEKMDVIASCMAKMHYSAVGIGEYDLKVFNSFLDAFTSKKIPIVDSYKKSSNETVTYVIRRIGDVKVGIVSFGAIKKNNMQKDFELTPQECNYYKAAREKSDVLILLNQGRVASIEWLKLNSPKLGAPDIVIGGLQMVSDSKEQIVGKTHILPTFMQAKLVGVADIEINSKEKKITVQKIPVSGDTAEDKAIVQMIKDYNKSNQVTISPSGSVKISKILTLKTDKKDAPPTIKVSQPYYPPTLCKNCHSEEYESWADSKHARAVITLKKSEKMMPECLNCHSEMYRRIGQVVIPSDKNAGVECETCHIDSLPHGMERADVKVKTKVDQAVCLNCHNKERSPTYNADEYMPKIMHKSN